MIFNDENLKPVSFCDSLLFFLANTVSKRSPYYILSEISPLGFFLRWASVSRCLLQTQEGDLICFRDYFCKLTRGICFQDYFCKLKRGICFRDVFSKLKRRICFRDELLLGIMPTCLVFEVLRHKKTK